MASPNYLMSSPASLAPGSGRESMLRLLEPLDLPVRSSSDRPQRVYLDLDGRWSLSPRELATLIRAARLASDRDELLCIRNASAWIQRELESLRMHRIMQLTPPAQLVDQARFVGSQAA